MGSIFNQFMQGSQAGQKAADNRLLREQQASDLRKKANFEDARVGRQLLEAQDYQGFLGFAANRIDAIEATGGNSSDTRKLLDMFNAGDIGGLTSALKGAEEEGITTTDSQGNAFLSDPIDRQIKQAKLDSLTGKGTGIDIGKYIPRDYTVDSFTEFSKNGDPSVLVRYESDSKSRELEIKEQVLELKQEKANLAKQKEEANKAKREIVAAQKKRDLERARFLEIKEGENAIGNIDALLDNDLDIIYGGFEWALPDKLRAQRGKNMLARRDQVASTMSLMAAGKLKGQGTITENERKMLSDAVSFLKNQDISADQARAELKRVKPIFEYFMTGQRSNDVIDSSIDNQALQWAQANPNDPRSAQIMQKQGRL